jgi:surface protein
MFKGCTGLTYINLDNFDTSKVTDMESMFEGCSNLTSLNLKFNTTKVQYMNKMFKDCISLENLYFKNINTSSLGTMHQMFYNCRSLKYVNLYNLEERGQSVIDIFEKASNDFKICVKEHENIPKIFNILYNLENANRDCSGACYGDWRIEIPEKKYCCPKFKYEDNCYDKCPSKTKTYSNYFDGKICQSFNCSYLYNYEQSECITSLTPGQYINDTESKTIDKCHKNCLTCKGKGIDGDSNCTKCKENVKNIYRGNCYDTCLD